MAKKKAIAPNRAIVLKDGTHLKAGDVVSAAQAKECEAAGIRLVEVEADNDDS